MSNQFTTPNSIELGSLPMTVITRFMVILAVVALGRYFFGKRNLSKFPLITETNAQKSDDIRVPGLLDLLQEGYRLFKNDIFRLQAPHGEQIVLPARLLNELKSLPENKISLIQSLSDQFLGPYTFVGTHDATMMASIREDLARNMEDVIGTLSDETVHAFSTEIPQCQDWTSIKVQPTMLRIIALLSGRVFVGPELNRNENFLKCIIGYTIDSFMAANKIRPYHPILRPFVKSLVPEYRAVQRQLATMTAMVRPLVEKRMRKEKSNGKATMIDWNMKNSPASKQQSLVYQAQQQLQVSFAAIHTTAKLMTNICFDLAARPEYVQALRDELQNVLNSDGLLTKNNLVKLKKMDSFMTESQRHSPPGIMTFNRRMTSSVTLSDGTHLPSGTYVAAASSQIAMDPEFWDDPEKFDGFRFQRMRERLGSENKYQFVSTGTDMLLFGYGTHSCPGRFFASNEIKIIFAYLLMNFDIALPDGEGRPKPVTYDVAFKPDPNQEVLFKHRV
ncbi:cytochrome P450 [Tricladium varicosporioides]|nr:cytochrome P450 [Hymenoscyphus varicosporioides]